MEALDFAAKVELSVKALYGYFATLFTDRHEISGEFRRLAEEEHLVQYQRRLVRNDPSTFKGADVHVVDIELVKAMIEEIPTMIGGNPPPSLKEAVDFAYRCEIDLAETHHRAAMREANPEVARLLQALGKADKTHLETLRTLASDQGFEDIAG